MANEIVQSYRVVDSKYEKYYFATVLSAVAVSAEDNTNAKDYIDNLMSATKDAMRFMGVIGTNGTITSGLEATNGKKFSELTNYQIGWSFKVGVAGKYANNTCEIGDMLICVGTAKTNADWYVLQANIDGAVTGPATAADTAIAMFDKTTGKLLADSGFKKTDIQGLIDVKHEHTNKAVLDTITDAMLELITHANRSTLDSITSEMVTLWNSYEDKLAEVESKLVYTNNTPTISAHGGIAAGSTFNKVPIADMFTKILYPYVAPTISTTVVTPTNGGTFEKGSTQTVTKIRASVTKKSASITKVEIFDGSTSLGSKTDGVASGGVVETYTAGDPNIPVDPSKTDGSKLAPGTYIVLTIANSTKDKLYIPADSLIEYVTAGTPATDDGVKITVSSDHKVTATLLDNAVTTTKIKDANVTAAKLAANAVETAKIKDGAVTSAKLASKTVTAAKIADATITEAQLAKTVTDKLAKTDKIVDATEETAGLVTLAGANSSKTGYDIAASVGYVNDTVNPLGQVLGNEIETSTQRYETIMGLIHGTDDAALNVRLTKVEETASTAKSTADSKTKVIWVDKNGTIPTTAEANTLLFQIL